LSCQPSSRAWRPQPRGGWPGHWPGRRRHAGSLWFGWSGRRAPEASTIPSLAEFREVTYATIDLAEADYRRFYLGFANGALYPLLLYRLGQVNFRQDDYTGYRTVNEHFARTLAPLLRGDDLVWVHDYQL